MPRPLLAVDAPSLLYRAFFALPKSITDGSGQPVNALLGVSNLILWVVERHDPRAVVLCAGAEAASYRTALYDGYHADRPPVPDELAPQWEQAPGGKDGPELIDAAGVRLRYGIRPDQVPDFIALRGDPSDGLPGAKGIGEKTAGELLRVHGDLETAIANASSERPRVAAALRDQADQLREYRKIATLQPIDVVCPPDGPTDFAAAAAAARARGMNRLAERLERLGRK
jgi:DNA polymerase-1